MIEQMLCAASLVTLRNLLSHWTSQLPLSLAIEIGSVMVFLWGLVPQKVSYTLLGAGRLVTKVPEM